MERPPRPACDAAFRPLNTPYAVTGAGSSEPPNALETPVTQRVSRRTTSMSLRDVPTSSAVM